MSGPPWEKRLSEGAREAVGYGLAGAMLQKAGSVKKDPGSSLEIDLDVKLEGEETHLVISSTFMQLAPK